VFHSPKEREGLTQRGPADRPTRRGPADRPTRRGPADRPTRRGPADRPTQRGPLDPGGASPVPVRLDGSASERVRADGKFFRLGDRRFRFSGVTYGTFRPRDNDGARFPDRSTVKLDFESMREQGVTVVRTYTAPPDDVVETAADFDLRLLAGVFYPDWRYLLSGGRREMRRVAREAEVEVRRHAQRLAGEPAVLGLCLGNEVPADVLRWYGSRKVASALGRLVEVVREVDPDMLVTYANYPTAEYLTVPGLDFLTYNVFLERKNDFRRYLTRLHHLAGDRPLVLGEVGLDAGSDLGAAGEQRQAEVVDWLLSTALERGVAGTCVFSWTDEWHVGDAEVEGWSFGLTRRDRSPRPALDVVRRWSQASPRDLRDVWPSLSVVVCAYNAAATLQECLTHVCALDYPDLEVLVVDDGSTDATADIAARHPRARLVSVPHAGLSAARNSGLAAARGRIVAYLDADAYPPPEWPYYLVLGFDAADVAAAGGPNFPPSADGLGAEMVARAPGGPVHVLYADDRAEHVPGCNMAFWRHALEEVGGFDPIYTAAGDDVDVCWKVLDRGYSIGFHPAAFVWHHRRPGIGAYLRQQRGYGRSEALVEQRHPDRFTSLGTARWRGRIYNSLVPGPFRPRVYRGLYGAASYQSVYGAGGHALDVAHQVGVPASLAAMVVSVLAVWQPWVAVAGAVGLAFLLGLGGLDAARVQPPLRLAGPALRFRLGVAACHLLQPVARTFARTREQVLRGRSPAGASAPLPEASRLARGVLLYADEEGRPALVARLVGALRSARVKVVVPSGWEGYDARLLSSFVVAGDLVSSAHPEGCVQVRVRARLRARPAVLWLLAAVLAWVAAPPIGALVAAAFAAETARGVAVVRFRVPRVLAGGRR
jgi:glycosyltransferase involved in cell wall biosynthesis